MITKSYTLTPEQEKEVQTKLAEGNEKYKPLAGIILESYPEPSIMSMIPCCDNEDRTLERIVAIPVSSVK